MGKKGHREGRKNYIHQWEKEHKHNRERDKRKTSALEENWHPIANWSCGDSL